MFSPSNQYSNVNKKYGRFLIGHTTGFVFTLHVLFCYFRKFSQPQQVQISANAFEILQTQSRSSRRKLCTMRKNVFEVYTHFKATLFAFSIVMATKILKSIRDKFCCNLCRNVQSIYSHRIILNYSSSSVIF